MRQQPNHLSTIRGKSRGGVFLVGHVTARVAALVADAGVPVVQLGELVDDECPPRVSSVSVDVHNVVHLALSHLVSLGHRRILLCSSRGTRYFDMVAQAFHSSMSGYGLSEQALEWYFPWNDPVPGPELLPWLDALPQQPTALLVEQGLCATRVVRLLEGSGWPVPGRVSVLVINAHQPLRPTGGVLLEAFLLAVEPGAERCVSTPAMRSCQPPDAARIMESVWRASEDAGSLSPGP